MSLLVLYITSISFCLVTTQRRSYSNALINGKHFSAHSQYHPYDHLSNDYRANYNYNFDGDHEVMKDPKPKIERRGQKMKQETWRKIMQRQRLLLALKPYIDPFVSLVQRDIQPMMHNAKQFVSTNMHTLKQQWFDYKMGIVEDVIYVWLKGSIYVLQDKFNKEYSQLIEPIKHQTIQDATDTNDMEINLQNPFEFLQNIPLKILTLLTTTARKSIIALFEAIVPPMFDLIKNVYKVLVQNGFNRYKRILADNAGVDFKRFDYNTKQEHREEPNCHTCALSTQMQEWARHRAFSITTRTINLGFVVTMDHIDNHLNSKIETFVAKGTLDVDDANILHEIKGWIKVRISRFFKSIIAFLRDKVLLNLFNDVKRIIAAGIDVKYDERKFNILLGAMDSNIRRGKRDKAEDWDIVLRLRRESRYMLNSFYKLIEPQINSMKSVVRNVKYQVQVGRQAWFDYKMSMAQVITQKWLEQELIRFEDEYTDRYHAFIHMFSDDEDDIDENGKTEMKIFEDMKRIPVKILKIIKGKAKAAIRWFIKKTFPSLLKTMKQRYEELVIEGFNTAKKIMAWSDDVKCKRWEFLENSEDTIELEIKQPECSECSSNMFRTWAKYKAFKMSRQMVDMGFSFVLSHIKSELNEAIDDYIAGAKMESDTRNVLKNIINWIKITLSRFFQRIVEGTTEFIAHRMNSRKFTQDIKEKENDHAAMIESEDYLDVVV